MSAEEEIARLRAERDDLQSKVDRIAEAIGTTDKEKIVHDVRNVLNEVALLRKLVDLEES